ncbi:hypothetical protein BC830DRAFT_1231624 [Chytriomyces sp. MP71]|nr:hypothetical protein BC830DRAFT_1231624 [Chytriomyces sp. MP71]
MYAVQLERSLSMGKTATAAAASSGLGGRSLSTPGSSHGLHSSAAALKKGRSNKAGSHLNNSAPTASRNTRHAGSVPPQHLLLQQLKLIKNAPTAATAVNERGWPVPVKRPSSLPPSQIPVINPLPVSTPVKATASVGVPPHLATHDHLLKMAATAPLPSSPSPKSSSNKQATLAAEPMPQHLLSQLYLFQNIPASVSEMFKKVEALVGPEPINAVKNAAPATKAQSKLALALTGNSRTTAVAPVKIAKSSLPAVISVRAPAVSLALPPLAAPFAAKTGMATSVTASSPLNAATINTTLVASSVPLARAKTSYAGATAAASSVSPLASPVPLSFGPFDLSTPAALAVFLAIVGVSVGINTAMAIRGEDDGTVAVIAHAENPVPFTAVYDPASCDSLDLALRDIGADLVRMRDRLARNTYEPTSCASMERALAHLGQDLVRMRVRLEKKQKRGAARKRLWEWWVPALPRFAFEFDPRALLVSRPLIDAGYRPVTADAAILRTRMNLKMGAEERQLLVNILSQQSFNPTPAMLYPMVTICRNLLSTLNGVAATLSPTHVVSFLPASLKAEMAFLQNYLSLCIESKTAHNLPYLFSNEYELNAGAQVSRIHVDTTTLILRSLARLIAHVSVALVTFGSAMPHTLAAPAAPSMRSRVRSTSTGYGLIHAPTLRAHRGALAHRRIVGLAERTVLGLDADEDTESEEWMRSDVPFARPTSPASESGSNEEEREAPDSAVFVHAEMKPVKEGEDEDEEAMDALEAAWAEFKAREEGVPEHILRLEFEALYGGGQDELDMCIQTPLEITSSFYRWMAQR